MKMVRSCYEDATKVANIQDKEGSPQLPCKVMSIEVAEHIPRSAEYMFMHSVVRWAKKGIILTWAALGHGGHSHVNCQSREYIQCAMRLMGMRADHDLTKRLVRAASNDTNVPWIKSNLNVFVPLAVSEILLQKVNLGELPDVADRTFSENYYRMTEKHCNPALSTTCGRNFNA